MNIHNVSKILLLLVLIINLNGCGVVEVMMFGPAILANKINSALFPPKIITNKIPNNAFVDKPYNATIKTKGERAYIRIHPANSGLLCSSCKLSKPNLYHPNYPLDYDAYYAGPGEILITGAPKQIGYIKITVVSTTGSPLKSMTSANEKNVSKSYVITVN